jgi:hypothetical protein
VSVRGKARRRGVSLTDETTRVVNGRMDEDRIYLCTEPPVAQVEDRLEGIGVDVEIFRAPCDFLG